MNPVLAEQRHLAGLDEVRAMPVDQKQVDDLADQILNQIKKDLRARPGTEDTALWKARGMGAWKTWLQKRYISKDVRGWFVSVKVNIDLEQMANERVREFITGGGVKSMSYVGSKEPVIKTDLLIHLNSNKSANEIKKSLHGKLRKELVSVLRHELVHLQDVMHPTRGKTSGKAALGTAELDNKDYYNDPKEVKAFMRQVVDEVMEYVHAQGKEDPWWIGALNRHLIDNALDASKTWNRIEQYLKPANEKKIRQAVATELRREWPKLQKLYPQDPEDVKYQKKAPLRLPEASMDYKKIIGTSSLAEQQRLAGVPITEAEDKYWRVEVDYRKVQWPIRVYYDIFGKGFADAIIQAPSAKAAIEKLATDRKRPLNQSFFIASPAKATDKPRKV